MAETGTGAQVAVTGEDAVEIYQASYYVSGLEKELGAH
jgi:hypothetical protein